MSNIKDWIEEDRPREKLMAQGSASLTNTELIAILLRAGTNEMSAVDLARELLILHGGLPELARKSTAQLQQMPGIGIAKAASIAAAFELGRRAASETAASESRTATPYGIAMMMLPLLGDLPNEECWAIYLDSGNHILGKEKVSAGGLSSTVFDSRVIIKKALERLASGIIIVHNHPSGNPRPSRSDLKNTAALKEAASMFDISLVDHIIIGRKKYYSFSQENC